MRTANTGSVVPTGSAAVAAVRCKTVGAVVADASTVAVAVAADVKVRVIQSRPVADVRVVMDDSVAVSGSVRLMAKARLMQLASAEGFWCYRRPERSCEYRIDSGRTGAPHRHRTIARGASWEGKLTGLHCVEYHELAEEETLCCAKRVRRFWHGNVSKIASN